MKPTIVKIISEANFDIQTKKILLEAIEILQEKINSAEFKKEILSAHFKATDGYSNEEILDKILKGNDGAGTIELRLELYTEKKRGGEVGRTENKTILTYRGFILEYKAPCYAAHLAHEYCHTLGFSHNFPFGKRKYHSVPYQVGNIVESLAGCE